MAGLKPKPSARHWITASATSAWWPARFAAPRSWTRSTSPRAEGARVHPPGGLPIGAKTPAEIAVAIAAELIAGIRGVGLVRAIVPEGAPAEAVDPVCGMTVTIGPDAEHLRLAGADYWFCGPGCRAAFANRPVGA